MCLQQADLCQLVNLRTLTMQNSNPLFTASVSDGVIGMHALGVCTTFAAVILLTMSVRLFLT